MCHNLVNSYLRRQMHLSKKGLLYALIITMDEFNETQFYWCHAVNDNQLYTNEKFWSLSPESEFIIYIYYLMLLNLLLIIKYIIIYKLLCYKLENTIDCSIQLSHCHTRSLIKLWYCVVQLICKSVSLCEETRAPVFWVLQHLTCLGKLASFPRVLAVRQLGWNDVRCNGLLENTIYCLRNLPTKFQTLCWTFSSFRP